MSDLYVMREPEVFKARRITAPMELIRARGKMFDGRKGDWVLESDSHTVVVTDEAFKACFKKYRGKNNA